MPNINLLPWREELRNRRQKEFIYLILGAAAAMLCVVGIVHFEYNNRIEFQNERNAFLTNQIAVLDAKIKKIKDLEKEKQDLLARMEIIEQLQASRPEIVHLMDELVETLPDGVYYTKIKQVNRDLEVEGVAQSNARVSSLMRNVEKSEWIEKPELVEIRKLKSQAEEIQRFSWFSLRFSQIKKQQDEDENSGGSSS